MHDTQAGLNPTGQPLLSLPELRDAAAAGGGLQLADSSQMGAALTAACVSIVNQGFHGSNLGSIRLGSISYEM